jgi:hypothetical protein
MAPKDLVKWPQLEEMRKMGVFIEKIRVFAGPSPSQQSTLERTISCPRAPLGIQQGLPALCVGVVRSSATAPLL